MCLQTIYIYIYTYGTRTIHINLNILKTSCLNKIGLPSKARRTSNVSKLVFKLCMLTPSSHSKNSLSKICSKGWLAQKPLLIGSLTAALRFSKGWVRKDPNLVMGIGCI